MGREEQIINERLRKLEELKKAGVNPYPNSFDKKNSIVDCLKAKLNTLVKTAGRIMSFRSFGKIVFMQLEDSSERIQLVFMAKKGDKKSEEKIKNLGKSLDVGDIVGVEGKTTNSC